MISRGSTIISPIVVGTIWGWVSIRVVDMRFGPNQPIYRMGFPWNFSQMVKDNDEIG